MVKVEEPVGVDVNVATVNVEVNVGFPEAGLKEEVAPTGRPEMLSVTDWAVPVRSVTVTVKVADWP